MSLLLFLVGMLISSTNSFYHALADQSGSVSYIAQMTDITSVSFNFILYQQSSYSSSPFCKECIIFNGTLEAKNIEISQQDSISIHIISDQLYIFIHCPISLTISIDLTSYKIEYTLTKTKNINSNNNNNLHCVFQQQQHESDDDINYIIYHKPSQIAIYHYYLPMKFNQFEHEISFNHSINPYLLYQDNVIYFIALSTNAKNDNNQLNLDIASYNVMDKI